MHICEFCNNQYTPRKQVKNPRACNKDECQKARQRDNENAWKKRHFDQYDKEYYEIQRDKRFREIQSVLESYMDSPITQEKICKNNRKKNCCHISDLFLRIYILGPRCNLPS